MHCATSHSFTSSAFAALVLVLWIPHAAAQDGSSVSISQAQLASFMAPARLRALEALAGEVAQRTSVKTELRAKTVPVQSRERFGYPLLFLPCNAPIPQLTMEEESGLATWLKMGGTLIIDWQLGGTGVEEFRASIERFVATLLPGRTLERVPRASVLYRSFYRVQYASGRVRLADDLHGVVVDGRYVILVSYNDLLSTAERGESGEFRFEAVPGGEPQREEAIRLLVNLVMYALCLDYKDDKVHLEYLKSKRNWRLPGEE
jgi:hypothetical protein